MIELNGPRIPQNGRTAAPPSWLGACRSKTVRECLRLSLLSDDLDRLTQLYLQTESYKEASRTWPSLIANIVLEAIDAFCTGAGLRIEGTLEITSSLSPGAGPAKTCLIERSPGRYAYILSHGLVFLRRNDGGRSILMLLTDDDSTQVSLRTECLDEHDFFAEWEAYAYSHAYLRGQRFYASGEFIATEDLPRLDDVHLCKDVRSQIERLVLPFNRHAALFASRNLPAKRGLILAGPPGTGKTMLCRAVAREMAGTVIWATARHFERSAAKVAEIWDLARKLSPTMLILEDMDVFGEDRKESNPSPILGEIMNQMDGADENDCILTLATTNRLDVVEQALRNRPGRFDRVLQFEGLSEPARRRLLGQYFAGDTIEPQALDRLAGETDGFTGARIMELARTIVEMAYEGRPAGANGSITITPQLAGKALGEMNGDKKKAPMGFMSETMRLGERK